jgi:predicted transcriptional regulator
MEFAAELAKRAAMFEVLRDGPKTAAELEETLAMSRSTIHRVTQSFCEHGVLDKSGREFELTGLGTVVAWQLSAYQERVEAAQRLEPFLNTVEPSAVEVPVEHFENATVTRPRARQPHFGVKRIIELIEASDSLRLFTSIISPVYVEVAHREKLDGTHIEVVFDEELVGIIADEYYEEAVETLDTGLFDVLVYDGVPFELFLFDDTMRMAAHDDAGIPRAFVETDDPDAIAWAERQYEYYHERADSITF